MEEVDTVTIDAGRGLEGDHKGGKFPSRGVTLLAREAWDEALAALADLAGPVPLAWTVRRANLLLEGIALPRARGAVLRVGPVLLEVTAQTYPCRRMEQAHAGLMKALAPEWRGGVCCRVLSGGDVRIGDAVELISSPREPRTRLPG
jgi:MOSC domain-containing protein YiiM